MRTHRLLVLLTFMLGLALRLAWVEQRLAERPREKYWYAKVQLEPKLTALRWGSDEYLVYVSTAVNAFRGRGFVPDYNHAADGVVVYPPLESLLVLSAFAVGGDVLSPRTLLVAHAALGALIVPLGAALGRRLVSPAAGIVLAFLLAVHPSFIYWTAHLMTESDYLLGLMLLLYLLARWAEGLHLGWALGVGACLGALDLLRVNGLYLGPALAVFALAAAGRRALGSAVAMLVVPFLLVLPWSVRNWIVYKEPIVLGSHVGINVHEANHLTLNPLETPTWEEVVAKQTDGPFLPEIERRYRKVQGRLRVSYYDYSNAYMAVFRSYIRHHPGHFARNYLIKFLQQFYFLRDETWAALPGLTLAVYRAWHWIVLVGGLIGVGAIASLGRTLGLRAFLVVFAYYAAMGGLAIQSTDGRYALNHKLLLTVALVLGCALLAEGMRPSAADDALAGRDERPLA
jgi:4-amino-4-deoxy-L-arabinose transferase-like glycosyltransferase